MAARKHWISAVFKKIGWKGEGARKLGEYKFF